MIHAFSRQPGFSMSARTLALALMAVAALSACDRKTAAAPAPRPVVAVAAVADGGVMQASLPAQIEARYSTPLSFRVGGKIIERRVRLGDSVSVGEIVARLDPPTTPRTPPALAPSSTPRSTSWTMPNSNSCAIANRRRKT